jgi:DNA-binding MarR family transcriptional regulator
MPAPSLQHEIGKRRPFEHPEEEALLNLVRTGAALQADFARLLKSHGLSDASYNVLRILRGHAAIIRRRAAGRGKTGAGDNGAAHEAARPRGAVPSQTIGQEMVAHVPDVTRLVDRLEARALVRRVRTEDDRRVVLVSITRAGLDLLARLDKPITDLHRRQLAHMTRGELATLGRLLTKARHPPSAPIPP